MHGWLRVSPSASWCHEDQKQVAAGQCQTDEEPPQAPWGIAGRAANRGTGRQPVLFPRWGLDFSPQGTRLCRGRESHHVSHRGAAAHR